jgi:Peptidase family M23
MPTLIAMLLLLAVTVSSCGGPIILSAYRSLTGVKGGLRPTPHNGVDFGERYGAPVMAAADGEVFALYNNRGCGIGVFLAHKSFGRYTLYCHLAEASVQVGQSIKRGDIVGLIGTTGNSMHVPHVHLVLTTTPSFPATNLEFTEDPLKITVGCFDPQKSYPLDRLVLTYPVRCQD